MSTKVEVKDNSGLDSLMWAVVTVLIVAGVLGNWYFASISVFYRIVALLIMAAAAVFCGLKTQKGQAFLALAKSARAEIRKVVWPTRQETKQTTLIVVVVVLIMSLILWGLDTFFGWFISVVVS